MGYKNFTIVELMLLSVVLGGAFAVIETQEQLPANENQASLNSLGSMSSSSSSSLTSKLSESAVPGKSSRYIIRFARAPSSMIRFSRSPSSQIRFGRSQPFVRFGRSGVDQGDESRANSRYPENYYYSPDENIQVEPRGGGDSGFIRFGRSQNFAPSPSKADALRAINWRNFLRLGRNTNANIRFAGKRDGSSTINHHNAIPLEVLLEKFAQKSVHSSNTDAQDDRNGVVNEDEQQIDGLDSNADQYQAVYSNGNDLEQN